MSSNCVLLAVDIVRTEFGDVSSAVVLLLLNRGALSLSGVRNFLKDYSSSDIRRALICGICHGFITFSKGERVTYKVNLRRILLRLSYCSFLSFVLPGTSTVLGRIFDMFLLKGHVSFASVSDSLSSEFDIEDIKEAISQLQRQRYIIPVPSIEEEDNDHSLEPKEKSRVIIDAISNFS